MDLSSLEICHWGIRNLPNVNTVADPWTTRNSCVTAHDWCSAGNYRGWPQRPCLALRPYPSPIQFPSRPGQNSSFGCYQQLFPGPTPQPVLHSPFHTALDATSHFYLLGLSSSSTAPMNTIINWFSSYLSRCFFSASFFFFFCPNPFFTVTPTQFFSWLPPPLAYSTFQSLMTFNNHLYELRAFVPESWITWSSSSSSNHMAIWRASTKAMKYRNMFRQDHCSGVLVIFLLTELHRSNFLWV